MDHPVSEYLDGVHIWEEGGKFTHKIELETNTSTLGQNIFIASRERITPEGKIGFCFPFNSNQMDGRRKHHVEPSVSSR